MPLSRWVDPAEFSTAGFFGDVDVNVGAREEQRQAKQQARQAKRKRRRSGAAGGPADGGEGASEVVE